MDARLPIFARPSLPRFALAAIVLVCGVAMAALERRATLTARPDSSDVIVYSEPDLRPQPLALASPIQLPGLIDLQMARVVIMEVTAYCPCTRCCGPRAQGITASGKTVDYAGGRFVAADTSIFPFGTRFSIPGYHDGAAVEVVDRGGAIKGNKLDVFFPSHETAVLWGRQRLAVTLVD